jgi:proteasome accessory factor A
MVFDVGSGPLRRVPMNEPLRGTESMVGNVIDSSSSAGELLRRIAG